MWVSVDLCLIPVSEGVSLRQYVSTCLNIIKRSGLQYELGPNGTAIEGEWRQVFECVEDCHKAVHNQGVVRIFSALKINTRSDKKQSFREKVSTLNQVSC